MRSDPLGLLVVAVVVALASSTNAQARAGGGPLALDLSYGGGDGIVQVGYPGWEVYPQRMAPSGQGTVVAKSAMLGGGSGEMGLSLSLIDAQGASSTGTYARLTFGAGYPRVADVIPTDTFTFVVGWHSTYDDPSFPNDGYGYVAAFPPDLHRYADWGTELFAEGISEWSPFTGLERLQEFDFSAVTAGAVDRRGRILVAGVIDGQTAVIRLTVDGAVDGSFGEAGWPVSPWELAVCPPTWPSGRDHLS